MTGYTVHTGSTEKFSNGWDRIFQQAAKKPAKKQPEKAQSDAAAQSAAKSDAADAAPQADAGSRS